MPTEFIPNQPVSFGADINVYPPNGCAPGPGYYAPVNQGDLTTFLLPNNCPEAYGAQMLNNGTFTGSLSPWEQGTGNEGEFDWDWDASNTAETHPLSFIINQPIPFEANQKYKVTFNLTLNAGCTLHVVLYRSYLIDSTDYVEVGTITATGTQTITFTPGEDFIRFGFYLSGDCESGDVNTVELWQAEYDCLEVCIKDLAGDIVETVTDIEYYGEFIAVTVDWALLGIENGCYYICICNDDDLFFGNNLFTQADNGTFESNSTGVQSDGDVALRVNTLAYTGIYSWKVLITSIPTAVVYTSGAQTTLKPNTAYKLSARVYFADVLTVSDGIIEWNDPANTGFAGTTVQAQNSIAVATEQEIWKEVSIEFTTGDDIIGHFELVFDATSWTDEVFAFVDNIILYEIDSYETCSQGFELGDNHGDTLFLEFTNDNDAFGFIYPAGFSFYMRIPAGLQHPRYPEELKTFRNTDGITSVAYADSTKVEVLAVNSVPEYTHDALRIALLHDTLLIEGIAYVKIPGEYAPAWDKAGYLAPVEVEVEKADQNTKNVKC